VVVVAAALVPGAGQQLAGLLGDRAAGLPHQGPDPRDLGAEPVIVLAQPVVVSLKLRYLPGERLQRCRDVLARLVRRRLRWPAWYGLARRGCRCLAGTGWGDTCTWPPGPWCQQAR
jgi:hypothetical protein